MIASASSGVSVLIDPLPRLTPLLDAAPACTNRVFAPLLSIRPMIALADPLPISEMVISEATPMMIPSVVRTDRKTFRLRARTAVRVVQA